MLSNKLTMAVAGAAAGESYWISTWGGSGDDLGRGIAVDSSGNVYVTAYTNSTGAGGFDCLITKYNTSGTIQWQRVLGGTGADYGWGIAVDSSGNVYVVGSAVISNTECLIAKYDTSGTIQWQRTLGGTGNDFGRGIAVDSSGNVYVSGYTNSQGAGGNDCLIAKYNTSGTIQWQRVLGGTNSDLVYGIAVDSSGNVYVVGETASPSNLNAEVLIAKYNTSGTIQWQRLLGAGGANPDNGYGIAVDSSGNVYVIGSTSSQGAGGSDLLVAKYDTSGTIQWQRVLGGASTDLGEGIAVDSSGNVYVTGSTGSQGAGNYDFLIAKYDTSGTIQWQRVLGGTGADQGYSIALDSSDNVYVSGYANSTGAGVYDCLIAKLPGDGTGTGTYGIWTYQASTLTAATSTLTASTPTLTAATSTLTSATSTLTDKALIQTFPMA